MLCALRGHVKYLWVNVPASIAFLYPKRRLRGVYPLGPDAAEREIDKLENTLLRHHIVGYAYDAICIVCHALVVCDHYDGPPIFLGAVCGFIHTFKKSPYEFR